MLWILQEDSKNNVLIQAVKDKSLEHIVVRLSNGDTDPMVPPETPAVAFGSINLCFVAKRKGWKPGTFDNENFDQRIWTSKYKGHVLNDDAVFCTFGSVPPFQGTKFMRPVNDFKVFAGMLVGGDEVETWKESIRKNEDGFTTLRADTEVSLSSPKDIVMEWRFFVVDGKVVTGSQYQQWGFPVVKQVGNETDAWSFAQHMVDLWQPSKAFVIDLALVDNSHKVIEINSINSSGLFASDAHAIVEAVAHLIG